MSTSGLLAEGDGWLAVDKPAGLAVIPTRHDPEGDTLQRDWELRRGQRLWVVHRLDQDTSGVVLFATDAETHRTLSQAFERRQVQKAYLAVCRRDGSPQSAGVLELPLAPGRKGGSRPVAGDDPRGKPARTRFRVLAVREDLALVEARPMTGRLHQIRVHLKAAGWPLAHDPRYGSATPVTLAGTTCDRLTLHAWALSLQAPEIRVVAIPSGDLGGLMESILQRSVDSLSPPI